MDTTRENSNENFRRAPDSLHALLKSNRNNRKIDDHTAILLEKIHGRAPLEGIFDISLRKDISDKDDDMKPMTTEQKAAHNVITKFSERLLRKEKAMQEKDNTPLELAAAHLQAAGDCLIIAYATRFLEKDDSEIRKKVEEHLRASGTSSKEKRPEVLDVVYKARTDGEIAHAIELLQYNERKGHK
jgi:hypothetical protein